MNKRIIENNIEYILAENDLYYPNLTVENNADLRDIGYYGRLQLEY